MELPGKNLNQCVKKCPRIIMELYRFQLETEGASKTGKFLQGMVIGATEMRIGALPTLTCVARSIKSAEWEPLPACVDQARALARSLGEVRVDLLARGEEQLLMDAGVLEEPEGE